MMVRTAAILALIVGLAACQQRNSVPPWASTGPDAGAATTPATATTSERRIGLLVPLTGRLAEVGNDLARGAEMAVIERGGDGVVLITRDTASTADGAVLAAREALEVGQADIILGPLTGDHTQRIAPLARQKGVPVLSFTSQVDVAGSGVYVLGFGPGEQVSRVAAYAAGRGYSRIAGLAPNDAYGRQSLDSLRATLAGIPGAELVGTAFYGTDAIDAGTQIEKLRGSDAGPPPFDALFIADGGSRLRMVSQLLPNYDIDPVDVRMLGTMLWQEDRAALLEPALRGAWYAAVADNTVRDFKGRFRRAFGRDAHLLTVLGYDGMIIADDAALDHARLNAPGGYQGEAGIIRFTPSGIAQHGLAIMELTPGGPIVIEPAPLLFDGTS